MYPDSKLKLNYETEAEIGFFSWTYDPLNTWSAHALSIWDKHFATLEHAYHYRKFADGHPEIAEQIRQAGSPWAAMRIDRAHGEKRAGNWHEVKVEVMRELMRAKLAQHEDVRECLLKTGAKRIVETSPVDGFWGSGSNGEGQNLLGKLWMELRAELVAPEPGGKGA